MSAVTSLAIADKFPTRGSKISSIKFGCVSREMETMTTFVYIVHYEYRAVNWCLHSEELKEFKLNEYLISYPISYNEFKNKDWEK